MEHCEFDVARARRGVVELPRKRKVFVRLVYHYRKGKRANWLLFYERNWGRDQGTRVLGYLRNEDAADAAIRKRWRRRVRWAKT